MRSGPRAHDEAKLTFEAIQEAAAGLLKMAEDAEAGAWAEGLIGFWPLEVFALDFDGRGGILVNPPALETATGRALWRELKAQGGALVTLGTWPRSGGAA